jgi:sphingomyelin phosphodiesterase acid-like 3
LEELREYSVGAGGVRVLSTNTNFFSIRHRNACGSPSDADPGQATLAWLEAELAAAKQAQEHVWLIYHIPPGIDGYATLRRGSCPAAMIPMWSEPYAALFYALLRRYGDTVAASFAGHTHMDDFRLIGDAGGRYAFALITPAVSPIFRQNPAFRTVVYDAAGAILDQTTYDLTNLEETGGAGSVPPAWRAEYTFTREWHLPRVDLPSLDRLYSITESVPAERERWHALFPVSSPVYWASVSDGSEQAAQAVRAFRCASGNVLLPDYRQCYCGGAN